MRESDEVRRLVGLADGCELMAAALRFPTDELASALTDGAFAQDVESCLSDFLPRNGFGESEGCEREAAGIVARFGAFMREDTGELCRGLRRGFSIAHVRQAGGVAVFPYESAFRHRREGKEGEPALFRAPVALDVERQMRSAGVLPRDSRTEPCDSLWDEFSFLSYLFGQAASASAEGDVRASLLWSGRARVFFDDHVAMWADDFFEWTAAELRAQVAAGMVDASCEEYYDALFAYGRLLLESIGRATGTVRPPHVL